MASRIVIVGMMGVGKTTVGRQLAVRAQCSFDDLDDKVSDQDQGHRTVAEIIRQDGEISFRSDEMTAFRSWLKSKKHQGGILAAGGGLVTQAEARMLLENSDILVIWLTASVPILIQRLGETPESRRPLLDGGPSYKARLEELISIRCHLYESVADVVVETNNLSPDAIVQRIWEQILKDHEPCLV